jgi:3-hydroxybutyryl-CoA dehydrogenase
VVVSSESGTAVVGGGTMGVGIAYVFAATGRPVYVVEPDPRRVGALRRELADAAAKGAERGRLDPGPAATLADDVRCVGDAAELPEGLALVVESVPEDLELKRRVLVAAEARAPALLATNTSSLSVDDLAAGLARPEAFCGMHFFNPVWSLPLVEVIRGARTSDAALGAALAAVRALGKEAAVVRDAPGFATSRLDVVSALEAIRMLEEGVGEADDIDRAIRLAYRHPVGPLRLSDIVGLDVRLHIARVLAGSLGPRFEPPRLLVEKVAAGELGRKTGRGFFDWT